MSMQLRIVHTTGFEYDGKAGASYNQARLTPVTTPEQIVVHSRLEVSPTPWSYEYRDYFGTHWHSVYGEINASHAFNDHLQAFAHVGYLHYAAIPYGESPRPPGHTDGRIGLGWNGGQCRRSACCWRGEGKNGNPCR